MSIQLPDVGDIHYLGMLAQCALSDKPPSHLRKLVPVPKGCSWPNWDRQRCFRPGTGLGDTLAVRTLQTRLKPPAIFRYRRRLPIAHHCHKSM